MKKMVLISIVLLSAMMMVLAGCKSVKTSSLGEKITVNGTFVDTKYGVYIGDIVVTDEALAKFGVDKNKFIGKNVEIKGYVTTSSEEGSYLDKSGKKVYVQSIEGPTTYMNKIESIKLMKTYAPINETSGVKIEETTTGELCGIKVGVGNIFKDKDKILRATFALPGGKTFRMAQGEYLSFKSTSFFVEKIVEAASSKGKMPGSSNSYVVLSCLPGKPYAAPEGVKGEEINAPNS